jgi:hypothetical protein
LPVSPAPKPNGRSNGPRPTVTLDLEASARQRDELLVEAAAITSFDAAAQWAKRVIPIKNTLTSEHAREVEAALEVNLARMDDRLGAVRPSPEHADRPQPDPLSPGASDVSAGALPATSYAGNWVMTV